MKQLIISQEEAIKLYPTASPEVKAIFENTFGKKVFIKDMKQIINTKQDVLDVLGYERAESFLPYVDVPSSIGNHSFHKFAKQLIAAAWIMKITEAYNGKDHKFNWNDTSEPKYLPYFNKDSRGRWVLDGALDFRYSARVGAGFYFKNREDALDAVEKFMDVYIDWLPE